MELEQSLGDRVEGTARGTLIVDGSTRPVGDSQNFSRNEAGLRGCRAAKPRRQTFHQVQARTQVNKNKMEIAKVQECEQAGERWHEQEYQQRWRARSKEEAERRALIICTQTM